MAMDQQAFYTAGAARSGWHGNGKQPQKIRDDFGAGAGQGWWGAVGYSTSLTTVVGGTIRVGSTGSLGSVSPQTGDQIKAPPTIMPAVAIAGD